MGQVSARRRSKSYCEIVTKVWFWCLILLSSTSLCCHVVQARPQTIPSTLLLTSPAGSPSSSSSSLDKRSATAAEMTNADYTDYQTGVRYDEYPVVVPKRTAMLLDRIMTEIQNAIGEGSGSSSTAVDIPDTVRSLPHLLYNGLEMDLQRRGQQKGRIYWRCYFNAVTCFKRK